MSHTHRRCNDFGFHFLPHRRAVRAQMPLMGDGRRSFCRSVFSEKYYSLWLEPQSGKIDVSTW